MLKVKVRFFGVIRDVTGGQTTEVEVGDDASIMDLVKQLHQQYGRAFYDRVMDEALGVRSYVKLFLNNEEVDNSKLATTKLVRDGAAAEAMIYVMPASTGG